jgi:hypothetical protein
LCFILFTTVAAESSGTTDFSGCPKIVIPSDATVIGITFTAGAALADIHLEAPSAPLSVVDVEIEPGEGRIFLIGITDRATVWHLMGEIRRVAGGLFVGDRTLTPGVQAPSAVTGLIRGVVWTPPPKTCPLRLPPKEWSAYEEHRQAFLEMSGREIDQSFRGGATNIAKVELPSGRLIRGDAKPPYRSPDRRHLNLASEAAKVWQQFLNIIPGGIVDIDPDNVISLYPASNYDRLPGLPGLAQLVSEGTLEVTGTPDDMADWLAAVGDDWTELEASELGHAALAAARKAKRRDWFNWWLRGLADPGDYYVSNAGDATIHGNGFRIDGEKILIEDALGNWVPLDRDAYMIRRAFTLPAASPSRTHQPVFLLPRGVPEPTGLFGPHAPLLREVAE